MMTREQIKEIVDYSQEHGITIKQRLQELNVPESNFYYAKRMYNREDMVPGVDSCFIQLSNGAAVPNAMPQYTSRKAKGKESLQESYIADWAGYSHAPAGGNDYVRKQRGLAH